MSAGAWSCGHGAVAGDAGRASLPGLRLQPRGLRGRPRPARGRTCGPGTGAGARSPLPSKKLVAPESKASLRASRSLTRLANPPASGARVGLLSSDKSQATDITVRPVPSVTSVGWGQGLATNKETEIKFKAVSGVKKNKGECDRG